MENEIKQVKVQNKKSVYNFIVEFFKENGYSPSMREISVGTGLSSMSSVYAHLVKLKMMGKIDMKENTPRSIRLIGYSLVKAEEGR